MGITVINEDDRIEGEQHRDDSTWRLKYKQRTVSVYRGVTVFKEGGRIGGEHHEYDSHT